MKLNNICPICNKHLQENDQLVVSYVRHKDWWCLWHIRPTDEDHIEKQVHLDGTKAIIPGFRSICGDARFTIEHSL